MMRHIGYLVQVRSWGKWHGQLNLVRGDRTSAIERASYWDQVVLDHNPSVRRQCYLNARRKGLARIVKVFVEEPEGG